MGKLAILVIEKRDLLNFMHMRVQQTAERISEARYAYYRRCQVFRKGGEQCKAPAEKGSHICYAHAGQLATAVRREQQRRAVLEEAVAQMHKQGRPECEMADLFTDFKGINVTLAVMAQALIEGRIDCKTAGRLVVQLQTVSKLLWQIHRKGCKDHKENRISPQICADERRLDRRGENQNLTTEARRHGEQPNRLQRIHTDNTDLKESARIEDQNLTAEALRRGEWQKNLPLINTDNTDRKKTAAEYSSLENAGMHWAANEHEETRIASVAKVFTLANRRDWAHAPPELLRAA